MNQNVYNANAINITQGKTRRRRIPLDERMLPDYTRGEEIFNMVTHIVGGGIGVLTLIACVLLSAIKGSALGVVCGAVFGVSMITLYAMSSIYHGLHVGKAKKVLQVMDHCTIYFLIAGTYTPMLLCAMLESAPIASILTFVAVWGLAALSITLTAIDLEKYKVFSMISYIGMGWAILFSMKLMFEAIGPLSFSLLLFGGCLYTFGVLFYAVGKSKRYFHSIFHIFVVLGSVAHSACVIMCAML